MSEEQAFLNCLREHPNDDVTRLVYADWLEEQNSAESSEKATYLRLDQELAGLPIAEPTRVEIENRLRLLAMGLPTEWRRTVAKVPIHCSLKWTTPCSKSWDQLQLTESTSVRFCDDCQQQVHYCDELDEAKMRAMGNQCIALDLKLNRKPGEFKQGVRVGGLGIL